MYGRTGKGKPPPKFISNSIRAFAPSLRGAVIFAKNDRGSDFKLDMTFFILPQFRYAQQLPRRGSGMFNINFNLICYRRDRARPCPQEITYKIKSTDNRKGCPYGCTNILI